MVPVHINVIEKLNPEVSSSFQNTKVVLTQFIITGLTIGPKSLYFKENVPVLIIEVWNH